MQVVAFSAQHCLQVRQLLKDSDSDWTAAQFENELLQPLAKFYVLIEGELVLGIGGFWVLVDQAQVMQLFVDTKRRRQGLGKYLMNQLIASARKEGCTAMGLEVRAKNLPAQHLYGGLGFQICYRRPGFYIEPSDDAVVMEKKL